LLAFNNIFRVKVWSADGTILWSDDKAIIGKKFYNHHHFLNAVSGDVNYEIETPDKEENEGEKDVESFLEIYVPIFRDGNVIGVIEVYEADLELYEYIKKNNSFVWISIFCFGVLLYCLQFGIFYRGYLVQKNINKELEEAYDVTIYALAYQAELRDSETGKHLERTSAYVRILAEELKHNSNFKEYLTPEYIRDLVKSAPLHDIGKSGVPDAVLRKPGCLNDAEFLEMTKHCELGAKVLKEANKKHSMRSFLAIAIQLAISHHEKWDGTGYPHGLSGDSIPLSGRIMALADVYDALRSKRVYKEAFPHEKCVQIIREARGKHFDPEVVDAFLKRECKFKEVSDNIQELVGISYSTPVQLKGSGEIRSYMSSEL